MEISPVTKSQSSIGLEETLPHEFLTYLQILRRLVRKEITDLGIQLSDKSYRSTSGLKTSIQTDSTQLGALKKTEGTIEGWANVPAVLATLSSIKLDPAHRPLVLAVAQYASQAFKGVLGNQNQAKQVPVNSRMSTQQMELQQNATQNSTDTTKQNLQSLLELLNSILAQTARNS